MNEFLRIPLAYRLAGLFALGVLVGVVLNWAIYRLGWSPRAIGPWTRRSPQAPPRRWFDRLPVLGWIGLARESALWGRGYFVRPMLIELATGGLFAGLYWWEIVTLAHLRPAPPAGVLLASSIYEVLHVQFAAHLALIVLMIAATFIDLDEQTIPDIITVPGALIALLLASIYPWSLPLGQPWTVGTVRGMPLDPNPFIDTYDSPVHVNFVKLTSPNDWNVWLDGLSDNYPLAIGLGCYLLWCFALLPRRWRGRRGWDTAIALLAARLIREPYAWLIGVLAAAGCAWIVLIYRLGPPHWQGLLTALVGLAASASIVWSVRLVAGAVLDREAMGFGDVTLMGMIGAFLGWQAGMVVFLLAPLLALGFGLVRLAMRRGQVIPYGPFLCMAALGVVLGWAEVWSYARLWFANGGMLVMVLVGCLALMALILWILQIIKGLFRRRFQPEEAAPVA